MSTCKGRKKDGTPCQSPIVLGNGYCHAHQDQAPEAGSPEGPVRWTRERLEAAIAAHGGPEGLELVNSDLSNLNLSGMDLHGIVLISRWGEVSGVAIGANLQKANLAGADLQKSALSHANLQGANLSSANLQGADLTIANLQEAYLRGANLQGANLSGANLQEANLEDTRLQKATLAYAKLQGAELAYAKLQEAILLYANLQEAVLVYANLQRADLECADLQGAILGSINVIERDFIWPTAELQGTNLRRANLQGANLTSVDLQGSILVGAKLQGASVGGADLRDADLRFADLREVGLLDVGSLQGIKLYRAKLDHTALKREQLGPEIGDEQAGEYREARDAYLALKQNFEGLGDYAASAWAYQKERQMEKATKAPCRCREYYGEEKPFPRSMQGLVGKLWPNLRQYGRLPRWSPLVWWFWLKYGGNWLVDWFVEVLCGYGESIKLVLFWMVAALFGFAAYYWYIGGVWLVEPGGSMVSATSFWHYLIYSAGAFTTTGFARFQAANDWVRMVTAIQAIVGIILAGLLGFVVGNRIRRS